MPVDETFSIRKNVISHGTGTKRFCVVTGTHGDELEGQMVCYEVARIVQSHLEMLDGTVEVYPALNPLGIDTIERGIPNFDLDMNRIFPGSPVGTMAEQTAYAIVEDLKGADMVLDVHSSNLYLRETPQVRINVLHKDTLVPAAEKLGIEFIWVHDAATVLEATLAYSLNSTGTPCLVAELGVGQRINHTMCSQLVTGIFNLMHDMGMWKAEPTSCGIDGFVKKLPQPIYCEGDTVSFLNAEVSGVFLTDHKTGEHVSKGDMLGQIVSPLEGKVLAEVRAPHDGFLFTIRAYPIVYEGSLMARIFNT